MIGTMKLDAWFQPREIEMEAVAVKNTLRIAARGLAAVIDANVPDSADKTVAIRKLRESVFSAEAAIDCKGVS